jgi:hypothetical protein
MKSPLINFSSLRILLLLIPVLIAFDSCSGYVNLEKRHYRNGLYLNFSGMGNTNNEVSEPIRNSTEKKDFQTSEFFKKTDTSIKILQCINEVKPGKNENVKNVKRKTKLNFNAKKATPVFPSKETDSDSDKAKSANRYGLLSFLCLILLLPVGHIAFVSLMIVLVVVLLCLALYFAIQAVLKGFRAKRNLKNTGDVNSLNNAKNGIILGMISLSIFILAALAGILLLIFRSSIGISGNFGNGII